MEARQLRLVGFAFSFFGVFLMFLGVFAYFFEESSMGMLPVVWHPYREYSLGLLVFGALVITVSQIVAWWIRD